MSKMHMSGHWNSKEDVYLSVFADAWLLEGHWMSVNDTCTYESHHGTTEFDLQKFWHGNTDRRKSGYILYIHFILFGVRWLPFRSRNNWVQPITICFCESVSFSYGKQNFLRKSFYLVSYNIFLFFFQLGKMCAKVIRLRLPDEERKLQCLCILNCNF